MKTRMQFIWVPVAVITTAAPVFVMLTVLEVNHALLVTCSMGAATFTGALFTYTSERLLSSVPRGRIGAWLDHAFGNLLLQNKKERQQ